MTPLPWTSLFFQYQLPLFFSAEGGGRRAFKEKRKAVVWFSPPPPPSFSFLPQKRGVKDSNQTLSLSPRSPQRAAEEGGRERGGRGGGIGVAETLAGFECEMALPPVLIRPWEGRRDPGNPYMGTALVGICAWKVLLDRWYCYRSAGASGKVLFFWGGGNSIANARMLTYAGADAERESGG